MPSAKVARGCGRRAEADIEAGGVHRQSRCRPSARAAAPAAPSSSSAAVSGPAAITTASASIARAVGQAHGGALAVG